MRFRPCAFNGTHSLNIEHCEKMIINSFKDKTGIIYGFLPNATDLLLDSFVRVSDVTERSVAVRRLDGKNLTHLFSVLLFLETFTPNGELGLLSHCQELVQSMSIQRMSFKGHQNPSDLR